MERGLTIIGLVVCLAGGAHAGDNDKKRAHDQEEEIEELAEKLGRRYFTYPDPTPEQKWLHEHAEKLLERTKQSREDPYRFDRLAKATDNLLEASERILQARDLENGDEDDRRKAARDLEGDYFRVQQADYFAKRSQEPDSKAYVKMSRTLYQQARRAFDAGQFERAETLGDAAGYVARALESLAQAAIRVPDPPRLKP
jgi:hypothetical protein